jgi:hypothetical protein
MNGPTAIETACNAQLLVISVQAIDQGGERMAITVTIDRPEETEHASHGYLCKYRIDPVGLSGGALASNPFQALRLALFQIRVKLVHRLPSWRLIYADGTPMELDYEESA